MLAHDSVPGLSNFRALTISLAHVRLCSYCRASFVFSDINNEISVMKLMPCLAVCYAKGLTNCKL